MKTDQGMVLITVLWVVLILSVISFSLAASVRTEANLAQINFDSERAFFMARGAAEVMYAGLIQPASGLVPKPEPNGEYVFRLDSGEVRAAFDSGRSRINVNAASDKELAAIFDSVGLDEAARNRLVDSILDWRDSDDIPLLYGAEIQDYVQPANDRRLPANGGFNSVDELLQVKSMTDEIFFGRLAVDPSTAQYRRIPGLRDLVTVSSVGAGVDPNQASIDVLSAIPMMTRGFAERIIAVRAEKRLEGAGDLVERIPELRDSAALQYLNFDSSVPMGIAVRATVLPSGVSRTVRLFLKREIRMEYTGFLSGYPQSYFRRVEEVKLDRWQYE